MKAFVFERANLFRFQFTTYPVGVSTKSSLYDKCNFESIWTTFLYNRFPEQTSKVTVVGGYTSLDRAVRMATIIWLERIESHYEMKSKVIGRAMKTEKNKLKPRQDNDTAEAQRETWAKTIAKFKATYWMTTFTCSCIKSLFFAANCEISRHATNSLQLMERRCEWISQYYRISQPKQLRKILSHDIHSIKV